MTPKRSAVIALGSISDGLNRNRLPSEAEGVTRELLYAHNKRLLKWSAHLAAHARALQAEPAAPALVRAGLASGNGTTPLPDQNKTDY